MVEWLISREALILLAKVGAAAAVLLLAREAARRLERLARGRAGELRQFASVAKHVVYALAALAALSLVVGQAPIYVIAILLAGLLVAGADVLRNWGSGLYARIAHGLSVGDEVEVEGREGVVVRVDWKGVLVETPGGDRIFVPSSYLATRPVTVKSAAAISTAKIEVLVPIERDGPGTASTLLDVVSAIRGELASDPSIRKLGQRGGCSVYEIELEVLNRRKLRDLVNEIDRALRESLGEEIEVRA
ncbi:MAG: mechanosensitive ion channel [Fervidicoccaceae archaeon]